MTAEKSIEDVLTEIREASLGPFDLLPHADPVEKMVALGLTGPPVGPPEIIRGLAGLARGLNNVDTAKVRVVVFGGGTGLSNIIGGDSRNPAWPRAPFHGLKELFPKTRAIVCVTDDGGSSGEILKDLPLIALGDLRHVLLSAIQKHKLQKQYDLSDREAGEVAGILHGLLNHRFDTPPASLDDLLAESGTRLETLPEFLGRSLYWLLNEIFVNAPISRLLSRPQCLGNLIVAAAIYQQTGENKGECDSCVAPASLIRGLQFLADLLGADANSVLPCTTTPAHLKILYENGVLVTGEYKSSEARRGCPMDRVFVEFAAPPFVPGEVLESIRQADIILFAPGSLFTSIVPILQVPGITAAIRRNKNALKMLIANLWIQTGETDLAQGGAKRRFYVSDLLKAYQRNIPGGIDQLFHQVMVLGLHDIPGSILQNYALEKKVPIYLDRGRVREMGFAPLEAAIYSQDDIDTRRVIQHDPASLAKAVRVLWAIRSQLGEGSGKKLPPPFPEHAPLVSPDHTTPEQRFRTLGERLRDLSIEKPIRSAVADILWRHWDIPVAHLDYMEGVRLIDMSEWGRCQEWDNVFSFYDPEDGFIKVRHDIAADARRFEIAFLVALGQSLLGNYAAGKEKSGLVREGETIGSVYQLTLRPSSERRCYFSPAELEHYLTLTRMRKSVGNDLLYTRVVNADEGFTPPGLLFGLTYAWYLDNRFSAHIEYKMSILHTLVSDLIPEQVKIARRRRAMIDFFRAIVFRHDSPVYTQVRP